MKNMLSLAKNKRDSTILKAILEEFPEYYEHMFFSPYAKTETDKKAGFNLLLLKNKVQDNQKNSTLSCSDLEKSSFISVEFLSGDYVVAYDAYHWHWAYMPTCGKRSVFNQWRKDHEKSADGYNDERFSHEWQSEAKQLCKIIRDILSEKVIIESFWGKKESELVWLKTSLIYSNNFHQTRVLPDFNKDYTSLIRKLKSWDGTYDDVKEY